MPPNKNQYNYIAYTRHIKDNNEYNTCLPSTLLSDTQSKQYPLKIRNQNEAIYTKCGETKFLLYPRNFWSVFLTIYEGKIQLKTVRVELQIKMANQDTLAFLETVLESDDASVKANFHSLLLYVYSLTSPNNKPLQPPLLWFKEFNKNLVSNGFTIGNFDFKVLENKKSDNFCEDEISSCSQNIGSPSLLETLDTLQDMYTSDIKAGCKEMRGTFKYFRCLKVEKSNLVTIGVGVCIYLDDKCYKVMEKISFNPEHYKHHQEKVEKHLREHNDSAK